MPDTAGPAVASQANLELRFSPAPGAGTYLSHQFGRYPFHICRAQYLDAEPRDMATVYLQSSAGGIFADDRLSLRFHVQPGAKAHVTSQASTVVHRMDRGEAHQAVDILAEGDGLLEYLPDPLILFPNASLKSFVSVRKDPAATVILADSFLCHDPGAASEVFSEMHNEIRVEHADGTLLCLDRNVFSGKTFTASDHGAMGAHRVQGTFLLLNSTLPADALCASLREGLRPAAGVYAGVSALPNRCGAWARLLSSDAFSLRAALDGMWRTARRLLVGSYPGIRRK